MRIQDIVKNCPYGELDYNFLTGLLQDYSNPKQKITALLKKEDLIRVKKGLYVINPARGGVPYCPEVLANIIYGPSYISKHYALMVYGMLPERVYEITSVTSKRNKRFETPIGVFSYSHLSAEKYAKCVTQYEITDGRHVLMATKEKALVDILWNDKGLDSVDAIAIYLFENLRLEQDNVAGLDVEQLEELEATFQTKAVTLLTKLVRELHA